MIVSEDTTDGAPASCFDVGAGIADLHRSRHRWRSLALTSVTITSWPTTRSWSLLAKAGRGVGSDEARGDRQHRRRPTDVHGHDHGAGESSESGPVQGDIHSSGPGRGCERG